MGYVRGTTVLDDQIRSTYVYTMRGLAIWLAMLSACGGWTKRDTILEISSAGMNGIDALETRGVMADNAETNPIMGTRGQNVPLGVYVPVTMVLHAAVSAVLPAGAWRTAWQAASIGLESVVVLRNADMGYTPWNADGMHR